MTRTVHIGDTPVGAGHPPVFLAEIGTLFNQDVALAKNLISGVAEIANRGLPLPLILKSELLHDSSICLDDATVETYQSKSGKRQQERYRNLIERKVLSLDQYREILACAHENGLVTAMSVYDFSGADFAKSEGVAALKIASSNVTHLPLIRYAGGLGLPLLIDNGRASIGEVDAAVEAARAGGCADIVLQHSPDGHPALPENHNLRSLQTLSNLYRLPVGLSDHFGGDAMLIAALALGADLLEKNVVTDDHRLEQDYAIAIQLDRLEGILKALSDCWIALGQPWRDVRNQQGMIATSARMGLVTARPVSNGEFVSIKTVSFAFPRKGIGAENFDNVTGWRFSRDLPAGAVIGWGDVRA